MLTVYYPTSQEGMTAREETDYNLAMINSFTKSQIVTDDVVNIMANIVINGDFETGGYDNVSFKKFHPSNITNYKINSTIPAIRLRNATGYIKLATDNLEVLEFGPRFIRVKTSADFDEFARGVLESTVFNMFTNTQVQETIVQDGAVSFSIPATFPVVFTTKNGQVLDIARDLAVGSMVQIVFLIEVCKNPVRKISLECKRIIKHDDAAVAKEHFVKNEARIAEVLAGAEAKNVEIEYED
jgi:hypothetical protein